MAVIPRGIRNHNPGNLVSGIRWEGLAAPDEMDWQQAHESRFCVFRAPWWGIRAMAKVLVRYYYHHELTTVRGMIHRYAPAHENPTERYARHVANCMGVHPDGPLETLDYGLLKPMMAAMIHMENGMQPYTWELNTGLILAGIEPIPQRHGSPLHSV